MVKNYLTKSAFSARLEEEFGISVSTRALDQWYTRGYGPPRVNLGGRALYRVAGPRGVETFIANIHRQGLGEDEAAA